MHLLSSSEGGEGLPGHESYVYTDFQWIIGKGGALLGSAVCLHTVSHWMQVHSYARKSPGPFRSAVLPFERMPELSKEPGLLPNPA